MNSREFKERYLFDPQRDLIAEGSYSRVFRAADALLQRDICVKLFRKELVAGSPLIRELGQAAMFFHPNVCAFYDLVEIEETNVIGEAEVQPIGIIEYMNGGTVTDYALHHKPDAAQIQKLIKDLLKGLSYLHSIGRPHLDIKPGHLLVKLTGGEPVAKITDFLNSENLPTRSVPLAMDAQQLCYRAPERFESSYGAQGLRTDSWSLGVIVYELVSGTRLFWQPGDTAEKVMRNICYTDYWQRVYELPEPYVTFVKKCLVRTVEDRHTSLEELTLILDGYKSEERPTKAATVTLPAEPAATSTPVAPPVVIAEKADVPATKGKDTVQPAKNGTENKVVIAPAKAIVAEPPTEPLPQLPKETKSGGLSVLIIMGSLLILAGISAFIWRIVDDRKYNGQNTAVIKTDTLRMAAGAIDTSGILAEAVPKVIHDTVKVVQIQQHAIPASFLSLPKVAEDKQPGSDIKVDVKVMPSLPYFDYLWVGKPYYFDLGTPLMSEDEYELYAQNAAVTTLGKNTFYVKPIESGQMEVVVMEKGTHARLAEKTYTVRAKSSPIATIGDDITGGFVSPKMLLAKLTMSAKSDNGNYKIKSFHMTCKSGACDIQDVSDNGAFNESMIRFLHNVRPGEKLYFDNIVAEDDAGQPIKLDAFQLTTY